MTYKLGEVVFLCNLPDYWKQYEGATARIVGLLQPYPVVNKTTGKQYTLQGYGIKLDESTPHDYHIISPEYLKRSTLERGDMDTPVTWAEFEKATAISESLIKGENRDY